MAQEAKYHKDDLATRRQNLRLLLDNWARVMETEGALKMRGEIMLSLFGALAPEDFPTREAVEREKAVVESMLDGVTEASQGAEGGLGHWDDAATLPAKLLLRPLQREVEMLRHSVRNREAEVAETQRVLEWMDPMPSYIAALCKEAGAERSPPDDGKDTALALHQGMPRWMTVRGNQALGVTKAGKARSRGGELADHDEMNRVVEARRRRLAREQERLRLKEEELESLRAAREDEEVRAVLLYVALLSVCVIVPAAHPLPVCRLCLCNHLPPLFTVELASATRAGDPGHRQRAVGT